MHPLGLRILVALGAPAVVAGCPPAREASRSDGTVAPPADAAPEVDAGADAGAADVDAAPMAVDAAAAPSVGATDAGAKPPPATYVQYKPAIARPSYCPPLLTAQCVALADAKAGALPGKGAGPACPPEIVEPCPCSPASPMGCQKGAQCTGALLPDVTAAERKKGKADTCCYETQEVCVPPWVGRALREGDGDVLAPVVAREDWSVGAAAPPPTRARFLRAALGEHAAVASFALTSLALLAHGAPAELVEETHRAALDEVEHARLMFGLAGGAGAVGPGPLPLPPLLVPDPTELVVSTFRDACLQETVGAVAVRAEADQEPDPAIAAVLARIADDEDRHAVLAYRTLLWALGAAGPAGRQALARELSLLGEAKDSPLVRDLVVPCATAALALAEGAAAGALPSPS